MDANVAHAEEIRIANRLQKVSYFRLRIGIGDRDLGDVREKAFVKGSGVKLRFGLRLVVQISFLL